MSADNAIIQNFELANVPYISKEDLVGALAVKVRYMLTYETEALFSRLYRLDIFEEKIKEVMALGGDIALHLANLIIERQIEKENSKKNNPSVQPEDDDLSWS